MVVTRMTTNARTEPCIPNSVTPSQPPGKTTSAAPVPFRRPRALVVQGPGGDTSGMRGRLTSSHLVGRVAELAELELALSQATGGSPAVVLIGGDSGVGKTRLLDEFERRVAT